MKNKWLINLFLKIQYPWISEKCKSKLHGDPISRQSKEQQMLARAQRELKNMEISLAISQKTSK